jgi:hypothetical protein
MPAIRFPFRVMSLVRPALLCLAACLSSGCGNPGGGPGDGTNAPPRDKQPPAGQPDTEEGARAVLSEFLKPGADHAALSRQLRPTKDDYLAVFEPAFAGKAGAAYDPAWERGEVVIAPKQGQTQLLVYRATTEDLKKWEGAAAQHFPGGYRKVAPKFKDGLAVYSFKFVEPGKTSGMAYDGLVRVNGNWRIFPKPWRVLQKGPR